AEAVRLRVEERLSLREIEKRLSVSRGSLSTWLREFPLTEDEKRRRARQKVQRNSCGRKCWGDESKFHRMVDPSKLTNLQRAKIAEAAVLFRLCLHGFSPYGSFAEGEKSDWLVVDAIGGRVLRIQVRYTHKYRYGVPAVRLHCSNGRGKA